jgi:hypothetical protein
MAPRGELFIDATLTPIFAGVLPVLVKVMAKYWYEERN